MSTFSAIAAVTQILVEQAETALQADLQLAADGPLVTVGPPQVMRASRVDSQLNLFLYQITSDAAWRNQDLPILTKPGERAAPLLALKLGYLVTAFGETTLGDVQAHEMLGSVMLKFHNEPVLPRNSSTEVVTASNIAQQFEAVRLTQQPMSLDEMSKLWSGFQSPYQLSVGYEATVVLIDSGKATRSALPVLSRGDNQDTGFTADAFVGEPTIESLRFPPSQPGLRFNKPAIIRGSNLDRADLFLVFRHPRLQNGLIASPKPSVMRTAKELRASIPDDFHVVRENPTAKPADLETVDALVENWPAGVYTVAGARRAKSSPAPDDPLRLVTTNPAAMSLLPQIDLSGGLPLTLDVTKTGNPPTVSSAQLALQMTAPLHLADDGSVDQNIKLFAADLELVGTLTPDPPDLTGHVRGFTWKAGDPAGTVGELQQRDPTSLYLRVQIDGVDSSLLVPATVPPGQTSEIQKRQFNPDLRLQIS
jgi:hypothetical protein